jgi:hypothetical protein
MKEKNLVYKIRVLSHEKMSKSGVITIEAAFVIPIVVFTIFALIYLSFYLHDYCELKAETDLILHKAAFNGKHEGDLISGKVSYDRINDRGVFYLITIDREAQAAQISNYLRQELEEDLFITNITNLDVTSGAFEITAALEAKVEVTLPFFQNLFDKFTCIKIEENYPVHNPAETIRIAEVILDTGSDIKGVADLNDKIQKFLGNK